MNEVRILILSPHTYTYGEKPKYYPCGDMFYLNPSSSQDLEELGFILDTYHKKGWVYIEEEIVNSYKNKTGIFKSTNEVINNESNSLIEEPVTFIENDLEIKPLSNEPLSPREIREAELLELNWRDIKKIALTLNIEYIDKETTSLAILDKEFN